MSSRDKDSKSLQDKLKVFFKKGGTAPLPATQELVVTPELERELRADAAPARRLRALRDLGERARTTRIQQGGVEKLWSCMRDLLDEPNTEARHAALAFLRCLAEGQDCALMRSVYFRYLRESHARHAPDDAALRFRLLHALTNAGRNIECFEELVGSYLLDLLNSADASELGELLALVINVVKYNASYLDENIVHGIVNFACHVCSYAADAAPALALLEAVAGYSLLPRAALPALVGALCRTANLDQHCQASWKLMRCVLGADIGHAALQELVSLLADARRDAGAARAAVFYVAAALWGPRRVSLRVSPLAVLPGLLQAVSAEQPVVTYEVALALQALLARPPATLAAAWDLLLRVLHRALQHDRNMEPRNALLHARLQALLNTLEAQLEAGAFAGDADQLLELLEYCAQDRPEASVLRLVTWRVEALSPARPEWLAGAAAAGARFVLAEPRRAVRLHALAALLALVWRHRFLYEEEVVGGVALPLLAACAGDADVALRAAAARALAPLAAAAPDHAPDLIDLLEKIMNRPFESEEELSESADLSDAALAVDGLLAVLHARLLRAPAAPAARACLVLLDHLDLAYRAPALPPQLAPPRKKILDMIFGLRTNASNFVGFCYDASGAPVHGAAALRLRPLCSPALLAEPAAARPPAPGTCVLPLGRVARALVSALGREREWALLRHALAALPALLAARAPCAGRRPQDLDLLANTLCATVSDRSLGLPESLRAGGQKVSVSEFHNTVLPALAALAPCHAFLEPLTQQRVVRCLLRHGMVLRTPSPYMQALTLFTLETRDTMVKLLPEVLLDLSKISDTKLMAAPMLEFLSTLTRLPRVFASFVEDQYMSVFAILLPYTNPSRYNHYVVSLAHHVVAAWFLKCRLSYRRNFVRFIIHGLHNYIIMPFEEQLQHAPAPPANEDSSNRKRSSSLGSRGVSATPRAGGARGAAGPSGTGASASAAFHVELTEACVDLLARYTASPCSVKPHRSEAASWMFAGGPSATWLVGHKLVTISTAGCAMNALKQGMCDRCAALCRQHADSTAAPLAPADPAQLAHLTQLAAPQVQVNDGSANQLQVTPQNAPEIKRYSKHSLQHSRSGDTSASSCSLSTDARAESSSHCSRQNSAEYNPIVEALNNFTQRFEKISKEVDAEETAWRAGGLAAAGACPCWAGDWAEVHVRSPSGDVAWLMRVQNQMGWENHESSLQDVVALLAPSAPSATSSGLGDSRHTVATDSSGRSSSGSAELHKSSSDSLVAAERRAPPADHGATRPPPQRMSTQPINIPGSPVRAAHDDDMLLYVPEGKSRHPVRRSNSSPEMSSSWKLPSPPAPDERPPPEPASTSMSLHASKKAAKKSDMRVSCEAIPEEMSGSSPLAAAAAPHPHLMTYNSDPGSGSAESAPTQPHELQKVASDSVVLATGSKSHAAPRAVPAPATASAAASASASAAHDRDDLPPLSRSKRSNTISVMSPTRRHSSSGSREQPAAPRAAASAGAAGGGVTPAFVLLQLYHKMSTYPITPPVPGEAPLALNPLAERPLLVSGVQHERTIKNLDRVPPIEIYKVGVLYVGPGQQDNEVLILKNEYGSVRYAEFLGQLGTLVSLAGGGGAPDAALFLNLEQDGRDGRYTYVWHDDVMQVLFHVATAMPASAGDPTCNEKRKYIGNDYVSIVYNDSGADFSIHTIKGQFNLCIVVVEPAEHGLHRVSIRTKDETIRTRFLPHLEHAALVVSDHCAAPLARQLALHCALASLISQSLALNGSAAPYASNSLERLRLIKRLRARVLAAPARPPAPYAPRAAAAAAMDDFNDYT